MTPKCARDFASVFLILLSFRVSAETPRYRTFAVEANERGITIFRHLEPDTWVFATSKNRLSLNEVEVTTAKIRFFIDNVYFLIDHLFIPTMPKVEAHGFTFRAEDFTAFISRLVQNQNCLKAIKDYREMDAQLKLTRDEIAPKDFRSRQQSAQTVTIDACK